MPKSERVKQRIKILGIIPARGGSKGIPDKNITLLGGKPLIYYTIREAKKSKLLDAFIVSTDSPKIAAVAEAYGADVPFLRPRQFARDHSRDIEFLKHAIEWLERYRSWKPQIVAFLPPTSPSRTAKDIDDALRYMIARKCDSVRTVIHPGPYNPLKMWVMVNRKRKIMKPILELTPFKNLGTGVPRQLLPWYCLPVSLVYATKTKFIKKGHVWGKNTCLFEVDSKKFVDVDSLEDLKRAEEVLRSLRLL